MQVEVERAGGRTLLKFTRDFDDNFDGAAPINALVAHRSDPALEFHDSREAFGFALSSDGAAIDIEDPNDKHRRTHAILMMLGWGALLPLGVIMANTLRTLGPIWCAPAPCTARRNAFAPPAAPMLLFHPGPFHIMFPCQDPGRSRIRL